MWSVIVGRLFVRAVMKSCVFALVLFSILGVLRKVWDKVFPDGGVNFADIRRNTCGDPRFLGFL